MLIIIVILGIAVLILVHELGHFLAAKLFDVKVEEFGFGFPPRLFSKQIGETRYSFNLLPLGGFVRLLGESVGAPVPESEKRRSFTNKTAWSRFAIVIAGVIMNFLLGWLIVSSLYFFGTRQPIAITFTAPDSPAAQVGLQAGDRITGFERVQDFVSFVEKNRGKEIALKVTRGFEELSFKVTPRQEAPKDQGALGVGIAEAGFPKLPFFASFQEGFLTSLKIVAAIFMGLVNLIVSIFTGNIPFESFVGPVGIFQVAAQTSQLGLSYLFHLVALISLNLAVLNIFPFPALDGGRLLFLLIEKIKGSPLPSRKESFANAIGLAFLLLLMVAITIKDIVALF